MRFFTVIVASLAVGLTGPALAQTAPTPPVGPDFSKVTVKTIELGNRTYMLEAVGGNITVAVGDDGVIMVDGQFAPMHDKLKAAIAAVTPQKVVYLVNTHHHGDHTGGNAAFAAEGATVIGHVNERAMLAKGFVNLTGGQVPPVPENGLPTKTYTDTTSLEVKGRKAELKHPANAHTGGDTFVYFADANVLSTGDTVILGRYPTIDYLNGGSINGMIAASEAYLKVANDTTKIVPGHGPLTNKAYVAEYHTMLVTTRDRVAALIKSGKTEQEVQDAKPFADLDAKWANNNEQAAKNYVRAVYNSLK